jgi:hypothetical protein
MAEEETREKGGDPRPATVDASIVSVAAPIPIVLEIIPPVET